MLIRKSLLVATAGALVIGFVGGINAGNLFPSPEDGRFNKSQLEKVKKAFPIVPEMRVLSGTIKTINGETITLEVAESNNPFDEWPTVRKVLVADTTMIIRAVPKDSLQYQQEMNAYYTATVRVGTEPAKTTALPLPPNPIKEEIIKLSDLKVGDMISVEADHNIKTETQFTASKISISSGTSLITPPSMNPPSI